MKRSEEKRKWMGRAVVILLFAAALLVLPLTGCGNGGGPLEHKNMPYEPDTPAPVPHEGVFVSEHGTMTFSGDGESVIIDFDMALAECLGLPEGEQEAKYVFLSGVLPPHGNVPVRYDVAHMVRIVAGEGDESRSADINIGRYSDGSFSTGTGCTTSDRITFFMDWKDDGDWEAVDFLKQEEPAS